MTDLRFLAACAGLLGLGAGLLWAGGMLAADDHFDIFDEDDGAHGVPLILPDPATYGAPGWMT